MVDLVVAMGVVGGIAYVAQVMIRDENAAAERPATGKEEIRGSAYAVDGDTLVIAGEHIRLKGIDAPELHQDCKRPNGRLWPCGEDARDALAEKVRYRPAVCTYDGRDDYDRPLARCLVDGKDVGEAMVKEGWAISFRDRIFRDAEREARDKRLNIWNGTFDPPIDWRAANPRTPGPR